MSVQVHSMLVFFWWDVGEDRVLAEEVLEEDNLSHSSSTSRYDFVHHVGNDADLVSDLLDSEGCYQQVLLVCGRGIIHGVLGVGWC